MNWEDLELSPRIISGLKKANFKSAREILCHSGHDLQRLANLSKCDVKHLLAVVASSLRRRPPTTGGIPLCGITELAGESGTGKTQFGLQLSLSVQYPQEYGGLGSGAVYICTEDSFPIKRLRQLITQQSLLRPELPQTLIRSIRFSDNIYIEHAADLGALQVCVSQRVPVLLSRGLVRLVVVDSVAALFRSEFQADEAAERARHMQTLAGTLHRLSHSYNAPVLCINQVTDVIDDSDQARCNFGLVNSKVLPALGMAWANLVLVRLMLRRLQGSTGSGTQDSAPRRLEVVFAPHLPQAGCLCGVYEEGVRGLSSTDPGQ
ncbi:DNA repair protein XRCC3 isoform X2 [Osmerus eperlanus]|uniref:DNA repair protein XRCC3 isoform X2 n=1 Tax=Osmerus eperlanus TaxID=29151 RepID=UPI002E1608D8